MVATMMMFAVAVWGATDRTAERRQRVVLAVLAAWLFLIMVLTVIVANQEALNGS